MGFVNAHFIAYTGDLGVTAIQGAYALATVGIAGLAGGLGFGFMADKYGRACDDVSDHNTDQQYAKTPKA